jgi:hypothetical protein
VYIEVAYREYANLVPGKQEFRHHLEQARTTLGKIKQEDPTAAQARTGGPKAGQVEVDEDSFYWGK